MLSQLVEEYCAVAAEEIPQKTIKGTIRRENIFIRVGVE
jgi:hypothetical protein